MINLQIINNAELITIPNSLFLVGILKLYMSIVVLIL